MAILSYFICGSSIVEKRVTEIDLATLESTFVFDAEMTEVVQAVYHDIATDTFNIIVTYIPNEADGSQQRPRSYAYRKMADGAYVCLSWYELPHISRDLLSEFSIFHKEVYTQPKSDGDSLKLNSEYFLNSGFFLENDDVIFEAMRVEKHMEHGASKGRTETAFLNPQRINYVIGDIPALVAHMMDGSESPTVKILYANDDDDSTVAIDGRDLVVLKYRDGEQVEMCRVSPMGEGEYGEPADGAVVQGDTVFYWKLPNLLYSFDIKTGSVKSYGVYFPGLAVVGCDFRNADASNSTIDMLKSHGGLFE